MNKFLSVILSVLFCFGAMAQLTTGIDLPDDYSIELGTSNEWEIYCDSVTKDLVFVDSSGNEMMRIVDGGTSGELQVDTLTWAAATTVSAEDFYVQTTGTGVTTADGVHLKIETGDTDFTLVNQESGVLAIETNGNADQLELQADGSITTSGDFTIGNDGSTVNDFTVGNDLTVTNNGTVTGNLTISGDLIPEEIYLQTSGTGALTTDGLYLRYEVGDTDVTIENQESGLLAIETNGNADQLELQSDGSITTSGDFDIGNDGTTVNDFTVGNDLTVTNNGTVTGDFSVGTSLDTEDFYIQTTGTGATAGDGFWTRYETGDTDVTLENQESGVLAIETNGNTDQLELQTDGSITTSGDLDVGGGLSFSSGAIASGTSTPTCTNLANCSGFANAALQYMRVGNVVTISARVDVSVSAGSTLTRFRMDIPVASNFTSVGDLGGGGGTTVGTSVIPAFCLAETTNDEAEVRFVSSGTGTHVMFFTATYRIL